MYRSALVAIGLMAGTAPCVEAQPFYRPPGPSVLAIVEGTWFYAGDPNAPCFIEVIRDEFQPRLLFTNEKGEQSLGRMLPVRRVIADDWGHLIGDVRGETIVWRN